MNWNSNENSFIQDRGMNSHEPTYKMLMSNYEWNQKYNLDFNFNQNGDAYSGVQRTNGTMQNQPFLNQDKVNSKELFECSEMTSPNEESIDDLSTRSSLLNVEINESNDTKALENLTEKDIKTNQKANKKIRNQKEVKQQENLFNRDQEQKKEESRVKV